MRIKHCAPPRIPLRVKIRGVTEYADVVELADTYDLGSYVVRHAGSSPVIRTRKSGQHFGVCPLFLFSLFYEVDEVSAIDPF